MKQGSASECDSGRLRIILDGHPDRAENITQMHHDMRRGEEHTMQWNIQWSFHRLAGRLGVAAVTTLLLMAVAIPAAFADSPHFISASAKLSGINLIVSFKEAGLGTNQLITYVASADATAVYVCVNNGGANPSAKNKTTVSGPVSATGTFSSGKNGNVVASLTLNPPSAGSFSCPSGQDLEVASVSYTNVAITDTTNGVTESIPGTFSTGCLLPNVRGAC